MFGNVHTFQNRQNLIKVDPELTIGWQGLSWSYRHTTIKLTHQILPWIPKISQVNSSKEHAHAPQQFFSSPITFMTLALFILHAPYCCILIEPTYFAPRPHIITTNSTTNPIEDTIATICTIQHNIVQHKTVYQHHQTPNNNTPQWYRDPNNSPHLHPPRPNPLRQTPNLLLLPNWHVPRKNNTRNGDSVHRPEARDFKYWIASCESLCCWSGAECEGIQKRGKPMTNIWLK